MSEKHRYVSTAFWDDPYISILSPEEKLLFMYLLTNPRTQICGVYEIGIDRMSFDTKLGQERISDCLTRFESDGKVRYRGSWVAMRNWLKHNNKSPQVKIAIERQLKLVPAALRDFVLGLVDTETPCIPHGDGPPYRNSNRDREPASTPVATARKPSPPPPPQITFDRSDGTWVDVTDTDLARWADAYPAISVERELRRAAEWAIANPKKAKKNWRRFLINWFDHAQEKGGR